MTIDASPAFQPDRPGAPGFQLAEDAGYQTQTPVLAGDGGFVFGGDSPMSFAAYAPTHYLEGDARLVLEASAEMTGPRPPAFGGGGVWTIPLPVAYFLEGDARLVLGGTAVMTFRRGGARPLEPLPRRYVLVGDATLGPLTGAAAFTFRDYVREVVLPDDDEVLALLMGGHTR